MPVEIEQKYLVKNNEWKSFAKGTLYRQGYIHSDESRAIRVRIIGDKGILTIKGATMKTLLGASRLEFEYEIPIDEASQMLDELCGGGIIEKYRFKIPVGDLIWEVDEFLGDNEGLVVAEVELESEAQSITMPDWIGEEVTKDVRYFNSNLSKKPYKNW